MQDQRGTTDASSATQDRRPLTAFIVSLVVGPVGAAMGWLQRRQARSAARPASIWSTAAVAVGIVQTLVVGALAVSVLNNPTQTQTQQAAVESAIDAQTPGPRASSTLEPAPSPSVTEERPHDLPPEVAGLAMGEVAEAPELLEAGAQDAATTTYSDGNSQVEVKTSTWADEAAAAAEAERARSPFTQAELIKSGAMGEPVQGTYWYYVRDEVATMVISLGNQTLVVTGDQGDVQAFGGRYLFS